MSFGEFFRNPRVRRTTCRSCGAQLKSELPHRPLIIVFVVALACGFMGSWLYFSASLPRGIVIPGELAIGIAMYAVVRTWVWGRVRYKVLPAAAAAAGK
jgi:hypothetical protein